MNWLNDPQIAGWLELLFAALCGGPFVVAAIVAALPSSAHSKEDRPDS